MDKFNCSRVFRILNANWRYETCPINCDDGTIIAPATYLQINLICMNNNYEFEKKNVKSYNVINKMKLVSLKSPDKTFVVCHQNVYDSANKSWGSEFLPCSDLWDPKNGYVDNGLFNLDVEIQMTVSLLKRSGPESGSESGSESAPDFRNFTFFSNLA